MQIGEELVWYMVGPADSLVWLYFSLPVEQLKEMRLERQPGEPDHRRPCMLTKTLNCMEQAVGAVEEFGHGLLHLSKGLIL